MAELQNQVKLCIDSTDDFLASLAEDNEHEIEGFISSTYRKFLQHAWCELPVHNADGSALATVACMPLWELLSEYTSICNRSAIFKRGFAVQMLTAMYPKSKDRRCIFQQLNCCGNNAQTAVQLSTHIPLETFMPEVPESDVCREYVKTVRAIMEHTRSGSFIDGKNTSTISALIRSFVASLLPKCTFVDSPSSHPVSHGDVIFICLCDSSASWNSGFYFLMALWSSLIVGEYLNLAESKELILFLRSSRWASQNVGFNGQKISYSKILSPLIDISTLCLSFNPRTPSTSVDTIPFVDPRVVQLLCGNRRNSFFFSQTDALTNVKVQHTVAEHRPSLMEKKVEHVKEQLEETIPNEIDFMGFSSSCRDFDQLAYLCRDLLFLLSSKCSRSKNGFRERSRDLLFNRKRGRGGNDLDGPCFIPVNSGLSHVMEKSSAESQVVLERLCCKWRKE